jgi:hypothetical protein
MVDHDEFVLSIQADVIEAVDDWMAGRCEDMLASTSASPLSKRYTTGSPSDQTPEV